MRMVVWLVAAVLAASCVQEVREEAEKAVGELEKQVEEQRTRVESALEEKQAQANTERIDGLERLVAVQAERIDGLEQRLAGLAEAAESRQRAEVATRTLVLLDEGGEGRAKLHLDKEGVPLFEWDLMAQRRGRLELERASALVEVFRTLDDAGALKGLIHPLGPEGALAPSPTEEWDQLVRPADVAGHFVLRRERLAELLEKDLNGLARQARIVPYMEEGRVTGFKLFGIRRASLPYALGLRNGDVVRTLGGMPLDSPDNALAAYAALRDASRTEVELTRRGKPVTFTYTFE